MTFAKKIISWYVKHRRDLPWRNTSDPYKIWISEIILQQTRVNQGQSYYLNFISRFPDIESLARSSEHDVLKMWQGLGYYNRAINIHKTAKIITNEHDGIFPHDYKIMLGLPGIGPYTAAAIASIAFRKPFPVMDGNVLRVISRIYGIREPVSELSGKKMIHRILQKLIDINDSSSFNQALMEFGALVCTPVNPQCVSCIFRMDCFAFNHNMTDRLPVKKIKRKIKNRYFNYLFIRSGKYFWMQKRTHGDIFKNLYELPLIETKRKVTAKQLKSRAGWKNCFLKPGKFKLFEGILLVHHLTHQTIHARFWIIENRFHEKINVPREWIKVAEDQAGKYPVPKMIEKFFSHYRVG